MLIADQSLDDDPCYYSCEIVWVCSTDVCKMLSLYFFNLIYCIEKSLELQHMIILYNFSIVNLSVIKEKKITYLILIHYF